MATESLPFIFGEVAKAKTKDQKKATLIKYDNSALRELLRYAFDPNLKFLLPPGNPPHKYAGDTNEPNPTYLYGLVRKLYLFVLKILTIITRQLRLHSIIIKNKLTQQKNFQTYQM